MMDLSQALLTFLLVKLKYHEVHRLSPVCHVVTHHVTLNSDYHHHCSILLFAKGMQNVGISRVFLDKKMNLVLFYFTYFVHFVALSGCINVFDFEL